MIRRLGHLHLHLRVLCHTDLVSVSSSSTGLTPLFLPFSPHLFIHHTMWMDDHCFSAQSSQSDKQLLKPCQFEAAICQDIHTGGKCKDSRGVYQTVNLSICVSNNTCVFGLFSYLYKSLFLLSTLTLFSLTVPGLPQMFSLVWTNNDAKK